MSELTRLVENSRKALQNLEHLGEYRQYLLTADQVFALHNCSGLDELLQPLSLTDYAALLRGVERAGSVLSPEQIARPPSDRQASFSSVQKSTDSLTPTTVLPDRVDGAHKPEAFTPAAPIPLAMMEAEINDPEAAATLIKDLLHGSARDDQTVLSFTASADKMAVMEPMASDVRSRAGKADKMVAADPDSTTDALPFSIAAKWPGNWFAEHAAHKTAATSALRQTCTPEIGRELLQTWSRRYESETIESLDSNTKEKAAKGDNSWFRSTAVPASSGNESRIIFTAAPSEPKGMVNTIEPAGQTAVPLPPVTGAGTDLGQLGKLVRIWEDISESGRQPSSLPETDLKIDKTGFTASENVPVKSALERFRAGGEENRPGQPAAISPAIRKAEDDQTFTTILERVLRREIRRYGLEVDEK